MLIFDHEAHHTFEARPALEQATVLLETLHQHTACFNAVAIYGWEHAEKNGVRLHHETCYSLRQPFPPCLPTRDRRQDASHRIG